MRQSTLLNNHGTGTISSMELDRTVEVEPDGSMEAPKLAIGAITKCWSFL